MPNVARGVGLGGSATLILACALAAPAVAEMKINVPAIHVETHVSPTIVHPPTPGFKTVVPQNSKNLGRPVNPTVLNSQKGGGNLISKDLDSASPTLYRYANAPNHSDPSLRGFTLASKAGAHREQLDDDTPDVPIGGGSQSGIDDANNKIGSNTSFGAWAQSAHETSQDYARALAALLGLPYK
jgi:hypothetical protein